METRQRVQLCVVAEGCLVFFLLFSPHTNVVIVGQKKKKRIYDKCFLTFVLLSFSIFMCIEMLLKEKKWKDDDVSFCYVFINSELEQTKKNVL